MIIRLQSLCFACVILIFLSADFAKASDVLLQSNHMEASLATSEKASPELIRLVDRTRNISRDEMSALQLYCGDQPAHGNWKTVPDDSESLVVEGSMGCYPGLRARISYSLQGRELRIKAIFTSEKPVEITQGLAWKLGSGLLSLDAYNHMGHPTSYPHQASTNYAHSNQFNRLFFAKGEALNIFISNPFHSFLRLDSLDSQGVWLDIFPTQPASSPYSSEGSWSQLEAGDTISRSFHISLDSFPEKRVFLSEHPQGHSHSLMMYFDELPNRDNWTPVTTPSDEATPVYSQFVDWLLEFPRVKTGLVLLTDRQLERELSQFTDWNTNHPQIVVDTLEEKSGQSCVHFLGSRPTDSLVLSQQLLVTGQGNIRIALDHKSREASSSLQICLTGEGTKSCHPVSSSTYWTRDTLELPTQPSPSDSPFLLSIESRGEVWNWIDNVEFVDGTGPLHGLENGGFEKYDAAILYDSPRRHWSDAHGKEYLPTAPRAYWTFLQNLDHGFDQNGWEDRVRIGCHGLKHTSAIDLPEPEHEFSRYDPEGDSLRLARISEQLATIGLSDRILRFFRPAGFRSTRSLVHPLMEKGTVWFDPGWWFSLYPNRTFYLRRHGKSLWGRNLDWWMDRNETDWMFPAEILFESMRNGHPIHLGGHPEPIWGYDGGLNAIKILFKEIERRYPDLGYEFPDDYADFATQVSTLDVQLIESGELLGLRLEGSVVEGTTLVFQGMDLASVKQLLEQQGRTIHYREENGAIFAWFGSPFNSHSRYITVHDQRILYDLHGKTLKQSPQWGVVLEQSTDSVRIQTGSEQQRVKTQHRKHKED